MTRTTRILGYMVLINICAYGIRGIDKYKAARQKRRISEKTLLIMTMLGGWIGAVIGMQTFHHKTIKGSFLTKFRIIASIHIGILILLLFMV